MPVQSINALTLATHDMARAVGFYSALGFGLRYGGPEAAFTSFQFNGQYLNLVLVGPDGGYYADELRRFPDAPSFDLVETVEEAANRLEGMLRLDDLLLIKGRGEQKLARIALQLAQIPVGCRILECPLENILCHTCPCREIETPDSRHGTLGATDEMA